MPFRAEHITTHMRVELGCTLVARSGEYGLLTRLAREHGVSRQFLYDLKERAEEAIRAALAPRPLGRGAAKQQRLEVDALAVKRAILVLSQAAQASVRAIGECLEEILGVHLSVGMIHGVLQEAASRAPRALPPVVPESPVHLEADELYAAGKPVLEVVESASGLVLELDCAEAADETTWGLTWLELLEERRVKEVSGVVADGARGLRAGLREAAQGMEASLDHWHTLRDLGRIERSLEKKAYERLETLERARSEAQALRHQLHHGRRPKPGRPKRVATDPSSMQAAKSAAEEAVTRYDQTRYVLEVVREVLHIPWMSERVGCAPVGRLGASSKLPHACLRSWAEGLDEPRSSSRSVPGIL